MNNLSTQHSIDSPEIDFKTDGQLLIKGVSVPDRILDFYTPYINWIRDFGKLRPNTIHLTFELEYINTSSTKIFIEIIKLIKSFENGGTKYNIVWKCAENDFDNIDLGLFLKESTKSNMQLVYI